MKFPFCDYRCFCYSRDDSPLGRKFCAIVLSCEDVANCSKIPICALLLDIQEYAGNSLAVLVN